MPPDPTHTTRNEFVLLVEDEDLLRRFLSNLLQSVGYRVESAGSASEAFLRVRKLGPPDVLVTDLNLPGPSGAELARQLRTLVPELPAIFISSFALAEEVPAGELLHKPFEPKALLATLRRLLNPPMSSAAASPRWRDIS